MKFNLFQLEQLKKQANQRKKKVSEMLGENRKNIYKNLSGHEDELNYTLYDLGERITGLKRYVISLTELCCGKVNGEYKMTTGHSHLQEEIYIFLKGKGRLILKYGDRKKEDYEIAEGDCKTIPSNTWHRVVNTGNKNLEVLCIFETYEGRG